MIEQRSILIFRQSITSIHTEKTYLNVLKRFKEFYKIKDYDSLIGIEPKKLQIMIEDYMMERKKHCERQTLLTLVCSLNLFFSMNDVILNFTKLKKLVPKQERQFSGMRAYTSDEILDLIASTHTCVHKVLIYVLASSGVRVGFVEDLKIKHLKDMPLNCKAITVYADTVYEYTTFITPEANEKLERYFDYRKKNGEVLTPDSFVFLTEKGKPYTPMAVSQVLSRIARYKAKTTRSKTHKHRYDIMACHGLRKFFDTKLKLQTDLNPNVIERLLSHKSKKIALDTSYFRPTENDLFEVYKKGIPSLTLSKSSRLQIELNQNKERLATLENAKDRRIEDLESDMRLFKEFVKSIKSKED